MSEEGEPHRAALLRRIERCQDRLLVRIRWMMGEPARRIAESQDFLGDVVARLLGELAAVEIRDDDHFLALATRMARHLIIDRVRRPRVRAFESFSQSVLLVAPTEANHGEELERVFTALEQMEPDHQRVIELRGFEQLSFREIGARMARSERAAQMLHARAMLRLGRRLAPSKG